MTDLKNPVSRRTVGEHPIRRKRIIATLNPGDVLSLRLERHTQEFHLELSALYDQAERRTASVLAGFDPRPCDNPKKVRNV